MGRRKTINWDEQPDARMLLVKLRKRGDTYVSISEKLKNKFNLETTESIVRHTYNKYKNLGIQEDNDIRTLQDEIVEELEQEDLSAYKETHEILKDGSQRSDKLIHMSEEDQKDPAFLLSAHGFNPDEWELVTARNNIWNNYSKKDGIMTSYASKITVKPRVNQFSYEEFVEHIKKSKPMNIKINRAKENGKRLLEVSLYDMHFPISDYEYYKPTQARVNQKINSRIWEEIIFSIGSDAFHNDDFRGRTSSGREIQHVDMQKAWDDARTFYEPLIRQAIEQSNHVKIIHIKGNHDESMSWAFVQMLKARFPQLEFDDTFQERKIHVFHNVFIGLTHGDKAKKNLHNIFPAEYPVEWSKATCKELHVGHLHREDAMDYFGTVVRTLSTRNRTDNWHRDNGYVGAHKRFMLFEYSQSDLESIHYV